MFTGSMPALVTPFRNGELDLDTLKHLVEWQIDEGSTGIVPVGTTGDLARVSQQRMSCGADFIQLSGEDATALGFNAHGGVGCISVTANVAPKLCAEFQQATLAGDYKLALEYQDKLMPLHEAIFIEPGLVGAKYALSKLGLCSEEVRSPLTGLEDSTKSAIDAAMKHAGLL